MIIIRLLWAEESERKIMMNLINATKPTEVGATVLRNYELPKSDWKKTIPEIVKIIRENPELFASLKKDAEELSLTQNLFLLSKGEEKLIESELELSEPKVDSLQWEKTREKLHNACEKTTDYDIKRRELMEKLLIDFTLNYCAVYKDGHTLAPWGEENIKIKKELEGDSRIIKLNKLIVNLHLWNEQLILLQTCQGKYGKMVRE